jgi:hypothetical protein
MVLTIPHLAAIRKMKRTRTGMGMGMGKERGGKRRRPVTGRNERE